MEQRKRKNKNYYLVAGIILLSLVGAMMLVSFFYTPYPPNEMNVEKKLMPPGGGHLFGTDQFGRDIFSRIMEGSKITFFISLLTVLGGAVAGTLIGAVSGYLGGWADKTLMLFNDALISFPGLLLALVFVSVLGHGTGIIVLALVIMFMPSFIRIVRGEYIRFRELEFIQSARLMGAGKPRIMFVHILPNIIPSILPAVIIGFSNAILAEASLSFLGLGVQPPEPSWGRMIAESQGYLFNAPWYAIAPGVMIIAAVLGLNFLTEGLRRKSGNGWV